MLETVSQHFLANIISNNLFSINMKGHMNCIIAFKIVETNVSTRIFNYAQ